MAQDEMKQFPKGAIAMDNGDLVQVLTWSLDFKNGLKLKHTLRSEAPVGVVAGLQEATLTFEAEIPAEGEERNYFELCRSKKIKQVRLKVPGRTYVCDGAFSSVKIDSPIDDAVKVSCEFMGRVTSK